MLEFIRPFRDSVFGIYNHYGIKLLSRLHLGVSHLNEHKFKHSFKLTIVLIHIGKGDIEPIKSKNSG